MKIWAIQISMASLHHLKHWSVWVRNIQTPPFSYHELYTFMSYIHSAIQLNAGVIPSLWFGSLSPSHSAALPQPISVYTLLSLDRLSLHVSAMVYSFSFFLFFFWLISYRAMTSCPLRFVSRWQNSLFYVRMVFYCVCFPHLHALNHPRTIWARSLAYPQNDNKQKQVSTEKMFCAVKQHRIETQGHWS